jgi:hypothetical protein
MKRYVCHKIVEAAPIFSVFELSEKAGYSITFGFTEADMRSHEFPYQWSAGAPYRPQLGDYVVKYSDGYHSISPKAAFESGYTLETELNEASEN